METQLNELKNESPPFSVVTAKLESPATYSRLARFECRALPQSCGAIGFAGGPGASLDWHPSLPQVLATAAHPKSTPVHVFGQKYDGPGHIQLWKFGDEPEFGRCFGLIFHDGHCIWDLQWCPTSSEDTSDRFVASFGNGDVAVYKVHGLRTSLNQKGMNVIDYERQVFGELNKRAGLWWVVQWSQEGDRVLVGSTQGDVALYDVNETREEPMILWEAKHMTVAVTSIKWLSKTSYVTTGNDKVTRVWDSREPGLIFHETSESLSWNMIVEPLGENKYILCTHEGEAKLVCLGSSLADDVTKKDTQDSRILMRVMGSLRSIVGHSLPVSHQARHSKLEHICYCAGSSGALFRVEIPSNIFSIKKNPVKLQKMAQIGMEWTSSNAEEGDRLVLRLLDALSEEDLVVHIKRRANTGESLLFNHPRDLMIYRLSLSPDLSKLAMTTGSGFLILLDLENCKKGKTTLDRVIKDATGEPEGGVYAKQNVCEAGKKGGRPRKSQLKISRAFAKTTEEAGEKSVSASRNAENGIVPKKRGRPRKRGATHVASSSVSAASPKRGRERPGKKPEEDEHPASVSNTGAVPEKSKRGGPKKETVLASAACSVDAKATSRKRQRPRKST